MAPWESGTAKTAALQAKNGAGAQNAGTLLGRLARAHYGAAHKDGAGAGEHAAKGSKIGHAPRQQETRVKRPADNAGNRYGDTQKTAHANGILRALGDQNHGDHGDELREDDVVIERSGEQSVEELH